MDLCTIFVLECFYIQILGNAKHALIFKSRHYREIYNNLYHTLLLMNNGQTIVDFSDLYLCKCIFSIIRQSIVKFKLNALDNFKTLHVRRPTDF